MVLAWIAASGAVFLGSMSTDHLQEMAELAEYWAARALKRAMGRNSAAFQEWVKTTWKSAPGVVHRHVRGALATPLEITVGGQTRASPQEIMKYHADKWRNIWQDPHYSQDKLRDIFDTLRMRAQEESLCELTGNQLRDVLRGMPPNKAQGVDALSPPDLLRLPDIALNRSGEGC